jgi:hypothetical protein
MAPLAPIDQPNSAALSESPGPCRGRPSVRISGTTAREGAWIPGVEMAKVEQVLPGTGPMF